MKRRRVDGRPYRWSSSGDSGRSDAKTDDPPILKWLAAVGALGSVGTAVLVALIRYAYERFYEPFAVTPEDVGIDSARVVTQAAFALLIMSIGVAAVTALASRVVPLLRSFRGALAFTAAGVFAMFAIVLARAWSSADDAAACAATVNGQPVRNIRIGFGNLNTTLVGIRADRATVDWLPSTPAPPRLEDAQVVFLGQTDSATLLYLPTERRTMRVPAGSVALTIDTTVPRYNFRVGCQPQGADEPR